MRYPYQRFLRYLVSRNVDVDVELGRLGVPPVGKDWVQETRAELERSAPPWVVRYLHSKERRVGCTAGFLDWAEAHQIRALWQEEEEFLDGPRDPHLGLARKLFASPLPRSILGLLMMCRFLADEICDAVAERCEVAVAPPVLPIYESLFWDHRSLGAADWKELLSRLGGEERDYLALGMDTPRPKLHQVRHVLKLPAKSDPNEVLRSVMDHAYCSFVDGMTSQSRPPDPSVFKWAELATRTARELKSGKGVLPSSELPAASDVFNLFSVKVEKTAIPTLAELEGEVAGKLEPHKGS